jgi:hypothetical protein
MHPILKRRSRLVLYLAVWIVFGLLLTVVFIFGRPRAAALVAVFRRADGDAARHAVAVVLYLVQSMPPGETPIVRMVISWVAAVSLRFVAWLVLGYLWAQYLLEPGEKLRRRDLRHPRSHDLSRARSASRSRC